jgi:5'-3' exonuclease
MSKPSLLLIDLSAIFWAAWHAGADKEIGFAAEATTRKIAWLSEGYDHVAICCDHPPYKRKEISPDYKAQRDAPPENAVEQFKRIKERLTLDGCLLWDAEGYEADDIIATACKCAVAAGMHVFIASNDKDLVQLVSESVTVVKLKDREQFDVARATEAFHGVPPGKLGDMLALMGDKSDNVAGIDGVGPKKAARLIADFGSLGGALVAASNDDERLPPALKANLLKGKDNAFLAMRLVALMTDAPIDFQELYQERRPQPLTEVDPTEDWDEEEPEPMQDNKTETEVLDAAFDAPAQEPDKPAPKVDVVETVEPEAAPAPAAPAEPQPAKAVPETAIVPAANFELALEPTSPKSAYMLAAKLYESRLWPHFGSTEAVLGIILAGRTLGLSAVQSLMGFDTIKGKPAPKTQTLIGRIKSSPLCKYWVMIESTPERATFETHRVGDPAPQRLTYTIEEAKQAGLAKNDNYQKQPATMLRWRCQASLGRIVYSDLFSGFYSQEELETVEG